MYKTILLCILSIVITVSASAEEPAPDELARESIRQRVEESLHTGVIYVGDKKLYSTVALPAFYIERAYRPVWHTAGGPAATVDSLLSAIRNADRDGFHPEDYHLEKTGELLSVIREDQKNNKSLNPIQLADLDLLLTDAFLLLGSHLVGGRVDPETFDPDWHPSRRDVDLPGILQDAVYEENIVGALQNLLPNHIEYFRLRDALARYREIYEQGGWREVPGGPTMRKGDRGERVALLRERLQYAGDYNDTNDNDADIFNHELEQAVIQFQRRHGIEADGLVGRETLAQLNTSVEQRIQQVLVNMERWRWLPENLGDRYILVNIANFELDVIENNESMMNMRVIVGRHYRRTPVFTGRMTYLVFSPYWNIPPGITANDILPQVRRDIEYLANNNIRVFKGWGANAPEIDPATVDWSAITPRNNPYRFRQDPGPNNSLGLVKFMFPNRFNVYLHDTPARELFARVQRDFSSGCIRVEKPVELSEYLLADRPEWTREAIQNAMRQKSERTVTLRNPIPVHLLYWTTWADEDGTLYFRRDIYNRDQRLWDALHVPAPLLTDSQ